MLSVIGGLTVLLGSSPLAAQTNPSASRSFVPTTVAPGGTVTVTITAEDFGRLGRVTEMLPSELAYVAGSETNAFGLSTGDSDLTQGVLVFNLTAADTSFTYQITASSVEGTYAISGTLRDVNRATHDIGGPTDVVVRAATPAPVATEGPADPPSLADSSIIAAVNGDAAIIGPLAMIIVKDQGSAAAVPSITAQPNATPPVAGFTNPAIVNGGPMYTPTGSTEQSPLFAVGGSLAGGYTIGLAGGVDNNDLTSDSYSFQVRIVLDEDGADGADTDNLLEHDIPLTANVTINVMRVEGNGNNFDVDPSKAIKGSAVSGLGRPIDTNPLEWKVTGVASSAKLVNISNENNGAVGEDFKVKETSEGSNVFQLIVVNSGAPDAPELGATAPINLTLSIRRRHRH